MLNDMSDEWQNVQKVENRVTWYEWITCFLEFQEIRHNKTHTQTKKKKTRPTPKNKNLIGAAQCSTHYAFNPLKSVIGPSGLSPLALARSSRARKFGATMP